MGATKRLMEETEAGRQEALSHLVEEGAIKICEIHEIPFEGSTPLEEVLDEIEETEDSDSYKDLLTSVYHEHAAEECYACGNNRDRD